MSEGKVLFNDISLLAAVESFHSTKGASKYVKVGEDGCDEISYDPLTQGFDVTGHTVGIEATGSVHSYWVPREMVASAHRTPRTPKVVPAPKPPPEKKPKPAKKPKPSKVTDLISANQVAEAS